MSASSPDAATTTPRTTPTLVAVPEASAELPLRATDAFTQSRDGTRIHYYTVGNGAPALVCCDGLGCDGYVWKYVAQDLGRRHRVVRFHYRGHGLSDAPADAAHMRVEDCCDDLLAVLDASGIDKAVLLGHSVGSQVVIEFHRRHPERVAALVPVCGSYGRVVDTFKDSPVSRGIFKAFAGFVRRHPGLVQQGWRILDTELAYQVATHTDVNGALVHREDFRPYLAHLSKMDVRHFFALAEDAADNDNLKHLEDIAVPMLIVAGDHDGFTPHWLSEVMHARVRGSELLTVPGGTHTAPIEVPELVTLRLRRWLDEKVLPTLGG